MGGELVRAPSHVESTSTFITGARSMRAMEVTPIASVQLGVKDGHE